MPDLLSELNEKQKEAVTSIQGPVLVLAGAGSGKTKTLTHRLAYLVSEKNTPTHNILAVTFTNKAAQEIRNRAAKLLRQNPNAWQTWRGFGASPALGTFHSICVRILREEIGLLGYSRQFVIYDSNDQKKAIKTVMNQVGVSVKEINPSTVLAIISRAKNELMDSQDLENETRGPMQKRVGQLFDAYNDFLKNNNALDFDDLLLKTVEIFQEFPKVLKKYQNLWQYIMIDEYQDTNHVQYLWARLLAGQKKNIFVVGDDWQGIYSWRGANIRNILEFEKDFPGAKVIALEQNYRSTAPIVGLGNSIIAGNLGQMKKKLWTEKKDKNLPKVHQAIDEIHEAEIVLEKITELEGVVSNSRNAPWRVPAEELDDEITYDYEAEGGGVLDKIMNNFSADKSSVSDYSSKLPLDLGSKKINWNNYAVLYRTNAQSRALEEVLLKHRVPYRLIGGIRFYERKEIKDTLSYLRLVLNPNDFISLARIINEPPRGVGDKSLAVLQDVAASTGKDFISLMQTAEQISGLSKSRAQSIADFAAVFTRVKNKLGELNIIEIIDLILNRSGYIDSLKNQGDGGEERLENIGELKTVAKKFEHLRGSEALEVFLEEVALVADVDNYNPEYGQALTLMTLHSAKGLEFETVFIVGLEEGLLPHSNSIIDPAELEEERRLCYVGITRAKKNLFFGYTRQRTLFGSVSGAMPSRFLSEMGDGVEHVSM